MSIDEVTTRAELGAVLEQLRARSGRTLRDLAARIGERCDTPIGPSALGDWCRGTRLPQPSRAEAFACLLDILGVADHTPWLDALARLRERSGRRLEAGYTPYPGLRSFGRADADWFFGRDDLVHDTVDRLGQLLTRPDGHRLLWVVGPSGSGKSSLLHAGIVPRLESAGHACLSMTPGDHPMDRLVRLLATPAGGHGSGEDGWRRDPAGWATEAVRRNGCTTPTVVVVDQFEEVLRSCDDESERSAFLAAIAALARSGAGPGYAVLLGLRIDFYPDVAARPELVPSLQDAQVLVGPMVVDQLTAAVVEPARRAGVTIERGLVALLLRDFVPGAAAGSHHAPGALPLLAHALRETWDLAGRRHMTADDYVRAGGVTRAVEASAERVYAGLDERSRLLVRQAFLRLVHVGDDGVATRQVVPVAELAAPGRPDTSDAERPSDAGGAGGGTGRPLDLVGRFVDARLLTAGEGTVEIAHESLLAAWPRLAAWIDEDRELLRTHRKISEATRAWVETGRDPSLLARGTRLGEMESWAVAAGSRLRPSGDEQAFLAASRQRAADEEAARRRHTRRLRALAATVAVFAVLAAAFAVSANDARRDAVAARDEARSRQLALDARSLRETDPTLAAQLAVTGYELSPTVEARSAVLEASAAPMAERHISGRGATALAVSGDGELVAISDSSGPAVRLLHRTARRAASRFVRAGVVELDRPDADVYSVALTGHGRTLAIGDTAGRISLWDVSEPDRARPLGHPLAGPTNLIAQLAISPDGAELAAAGGEGGVDRWRIDDPARPRPLPRLAARAAEGPPERPAPRTTSVAFAGDAVVAVGDTTGHVALWRVDGEPRMVADLPVGTPQVFDVSFSADGATLVTGSAAEGKVTVWDVSTPARPQPVRIAGSRFESWVNTTAFSRDGAFLAAGSSDQELRVWDAATWAPVLALPHPAQVAHVAFLPHDPVVVSTAEDGVVRAWDLRRLRNPHVAGDVWSVSYTADGATLAAFSTEEVRVWHDAAAGLPRPGAPIPARGVLSGAGDMTTDGRVVAIGTAEGAVDLVDISDPEAPRPLGDPLAGVTDTVQALAFSGDDRLLAAASDDSSVGVWDVRDSDGPRLVARLREPTHKVWGVAWSQTGRLLAATGEDDLVHLYDLGDPASPRRLATIDTLHSDGYGAVSSPDGTTLAVGGSDGIVTLWDIARPAQPVPLGDPLAGPRAQVTQLAWDARGERLAAAVIDGTTWLWDVSDPVRRATLAVLRTDAGLNALAFRPGHEELTSAGAAGTLHVWSTDADVVVEDVCARTGEGITASEWQRYVPGAPHDPAGAGGER